MNIITALNKRYIPYTVVMITSLAINNKVPIDVYLLHSELSKEDLSSIKKALDDYHITIHELFVERRLFSSKLPCNDQWSVETYYRLMMLDLLPENVDRILYLDGDMVINGSLKDIYDLDFAGMDIVACDDKCGLNTVESYGPKNRSMLKEAYESGYRYFNAGVMLMNLRQMRDNYSFKTYLDAIEAWNYEMEAPDQDILNWVHWKKVGYIDCQVYDLFARVAHNAGITYEEVKKAVIIVHFAGAKPWDNDGFHFDIERIWWDYAKYTPYYEKLLNDFVDSAMKDKTIAIFLEKLLQDNSELRRTLKSIKEQMDRLTREKLEL